MANWLWDYEAILRENYVDWYDDFCTTKGRTPTDAEEDDYWGQA